MIIPPVIPLFENLDNIKLGNPIVNQYITELTLSKLPDAGVVFEYATDMLYEQKHAENSFKAYRSELTTFLHWCFDVAIMSPAQLTRQEISRYVDYCSNPPKELIGFFNVAQFIKNKDTDSTGPNPKWRPFTGKKKLGIEQPYILSDNALKTKVAILSSFYIFLMAEDYCERNPAQTWLNRSRFSHRKKFKLINDDDNLKSFTELQWSYIISCVDKLAKEQPDVFCRHQFLIKLMYSCYLRISEISARAGYSPVMGQFRQNQQTGIWSFYIPISKGGKPRSVILSTLLLTSLTQYRQFLGLSDLPKRSETLPIFIRHRAAGRGRETGVINANLGIRQLRDDIDSIIQLSADTAHHDGFDQDAIDMRAMTAHNIRHTGISHDININRRPLSHVQADAGHESIDTTSQYLHTSHAERHQSAAGKPLNHLDGIF